MPKKEGIRMIEPSSIKKKPIIETARIGQSNISDGFWCVRHQHWASGTNGIGWKNEECQPAGRENQFGAIIRTEKVNTVNNAGPPLRVGTLDYVPQHEFWCNVHNHLATKSSCTPDCRGLHPHSHEFWCTVHNHWATKYSCTADCRDGVVSRSNDLPVELL